MAEILVLQLDRSRSESMAVEYVKSLGAELGPQRLPYRERFRYREIFIQVRESADLGVIAGGIAEPVQTGRNGLIRKRPRAAGRITAERHKEVVDRRIEFHTPVWLPSVIRRNERGASTIGVAVKRQ